jgi:hypothetical protein
VDRRTRADLRSKRRQPSFGIILTLGNIQETAQILFSILPFRRSGNFVSTTADKNTNILHNVHHVQEIIVGFRTPSGEITTVQSFKTINIPRLVRGKPGAWDPLVCLEWGQQFLKFIKNIVQDQKHTDRDNRVWRVKFTPRVGVSVSLLDEAGVEEVVAGEDRVGFLPRSYWDCLTGDNEEPRASKAQSIPPGWNI